MYYFKVLKAVKTLTEYFILRYKYRRGVFEGFEDVYRSGDELRLKTLDTEIVFFLKPAIKNYYIETDKQKLMIIYETTKPSFLDFKKKIQSDFFSIYELQYNIFSNFMTSELFFPNIEEEADFKKYYGTKLPVLLKSDRICKYLDCKKGELVFFKRRKTNSIYVRIVD